MNSILKSHSCNYKVDKYQKALDVDFGKKNEDETQTVLCEFFDAKVNKYTKKYSTFDYWICDENGKITDMIELKSRRNNLERYDTQLIGYNKYSRAIKEIKKGIRVWFAFKLTCGTYIYRVNPNDNFKTCFTGNYYRNDKTSELLLIPNKLLLKITPTI